MSLLARTLLAVAALSICSTAGVAKEIKGTPKELIGNKYTDGKSCDPEYFGDQDEFRIVFDDRFYNTCGGMVCSYEILSHRVVPKGFILKVRSSLAKDTWQERITVLSDRVIKFGPRQIKLHRCG